MLSGPEMRQQAEVQVINSEYYMRQTRTPHNYGPIDPKMGSSKKEGVCSTCFQKVLECPGHFGFLELNVPVFNIGFKAYIYSILRKICKSCSRVLIPEAERGKYLRALKRVDLDYPTRINIARTIQKECEKNIKKPCLWCGEWNGPIKKAGLIKFTHEKWAGKKGIAEQDRFKEGYKEVIDSNPDIFSQLDKIYEDLTPIRVRSLFERIPESDLPLLDMDPKIVRPEHMILTHMIVPPCCIRPTVMSMKGANEDELTVRIKDIVAYDNAIRTSIKNGTKMDALMDQWEALQLQCAIFINSEFPGRPREEGGKKKISRGLVQRLKGKQGRFRGNLSGKRVDYSGRTVISPDPNLRIDQVGVPLDMAKILTFPERVTPNNLKRMKRLVANGSDTHPGAKHVISADGRTRFLKAGMNNIELKIGDIVERHLDDGDIVLFNRQPSLHRISIMAHRVKVLPGKTLRFNECVCTPYNADFDGDEMNLHVPQTQEARAEARELLSVVKNLATPKSGELLIGATQDFLTTSYLITSKDVFFDRAKFAQFCSFITDGNRKVDLPPPAILKPVELYTGKQVFSVLIRHTFDNATKVNLARDNRTMSKGLENPIMCPKDGYVVMRNGEHMIGRMDKNILGGGKNNLFQLLLRDFSPETAADRMSRLARFSARFIGDFGFSIGIGDVTPDEKIQKGKEALMKKGYSKCDELILQYKKGFLKPDPGSTLEETLETKVTAELSELRSKAGNLCTDNLPHFNSPLIMSNCGSKGSTINIAQMIACVGQQVLNGSRIPNGFVNRSLPHFKVGGREPADRGFVMNSFFSGLTPTEFFFHTMGGREGLIDTAVKTAETGYMQRRLVKCLEDAAVQYDNTVRQVGTQSIVQFEYGDDRIEPTFVEADTLPVHYEHTMSHIMAQNEKPETPLTPEQVKERLREVFSRNEHLAVLTERHRNDIIKFLLNPKPSWERHRLDKNGLELFLAEITKKMRFCTVEPGTAVGALCAQSVGEPCTQMTLKTFHFAGVASMNITLGVPRIREIINATKSISTPIITAQLNDPLSEDQARNCKGQIERVTLGDITEYIAEIYKPNARPFLSIEIDWSLVVSLRLRLNVYSIRNAILSDKTQKLKLKEEDVDVSTKNKIIIRPPGVSDSVYFALQNLKMKLPNIVVCGIPSVSRCIIAKKSEKDIAEEKKAKAAAEKFPWEWLPSKDSLWDLHFVDPQLKEDPTPSNPISTPKVKEEKMEDKKIAPPKTDTKKEDTELKLLIEGLGLRRVLGIEGINSEETITNHAIESEQVLGIEAARMTLINQLNYTMKEHGVSPDIRHLMLLADIMTYKGKILGFTRTGIAEMKNSMLMLASFERTTDFIFDAAAYALKEHVAGVSERIILGTDIPLGTGIFSLLQKHEPTTTKPYKKKLLLDDFHLSLQDIIQ
uniref:DNA-directed RNA polymerase subunit n=1 Tax=Arcella intermedia TaxID=1963864 RepID=A0A6B2KWD9_9EUKA